MTAQEKMTIDRAMNAKGFAEFLADHPDADSFDMSNEEEVGKRFEVFKMVEEVGKEMKEIYAGHIQKEMGIRLERDDLFCIDDYLDTLAIENPEELKEMQGKFAAFKALPQEINKFERELSRLGVAPALSTQLDTMREDWQNLQKVKGDISDVGKTKLAFETVFTFAKSMPMLLEILPGVNMSREYKAEVIHDRQRVTGRWDALKAVKEKFGELEPEDVAKKMAGLEEQITTIENTLASIDELEQFKSLSEQMFGDVKKKVLGGITEIAGLSEAIQRKAQDQLVGLTNKGTFAALTQAQKRFDTLKAAAESNEEGINPIGSIDEEGFQRSVDEALKVKASNEIMSIVMRTKMGDNALTRLEKALGPFLKNDKIGSKEGDEAKKFIVGALNEVAENLDTSNESRAKRLMISRIIFKINNPRPPTI